MLHDRGTLASQLIKSDKTGGTEEHNAYTDSGKINRQSQWQRKILFIQSKITLYNLSVPVCLFRLYLQMLLWELVSVFRTTVISCISFSYISCARLFSVWLPQRLPLLCLFGDKRSWLTRWLITLCRAISRNEWCHERPNCDLWWSHLHFDVAGVAVAPVM